MKTRKNVVTAGLCKTDLEGHMFSPTRRPRRRRRVPVTETVGDWLRDWILGGRSRWRSLAGATN